MWKRKRGQSVTAEYVVLIAVTAIAITTITVYLRRALQARMRDASVLTTARATKALGQDVLLEYEPYYVNTTADTAYQTAQEQRTINAENRRNNLTTERRSSTTSVQVPF